MSKLTPDEEWRRMLTFLPRGMAIRMHRSNSVGVTKQPEDLADGLGVKVQPEKDGSGVWFVKGKIYR